MLVLCCDGRDALLFLLQEPLQSLSVSPSGLFQQVGGSITGPRLHGNVFHTI